MGKRWHERRRISRLQVRPANEPRFHLDGQFLLLQHPSPFDQRPSRDRTPNLIPMRFNPRGACLLGVIGLPIAKKWLFWSWFLGP